MVGPTARRQNIVLHNEIGNMRHLPAYALRNHSSVSRHRSREAIEVKGYHGRGVSDANSRSVPFVGADR